MEITQWFTAWWRGPQRFVGATTREPSERQNISVSEDRPGPCHGASSDVRLWSRSEGFSTDPIRPWAHGLF